MTDPFFGVLERARTLPNKLKAADSKRLAGLLGRLSRKPLTKIGGKLFNRLEAFKNDIIVLLVSNGHAAEVKAATRRDGSIDWEKLLQLLIKYLPQILQIISVLF